MSLTIADIERQLEKELENFTCADPEDFPNIDLYMDQVTTFMDDHLSRFTRHPEDDKILTKTMINNYVKNKVLIPPVKKKYGKDHLLLLVMIFYMKSVLSIGDIAQVLSPVSDRYASPTSKGAAVPREDTGADITLSDIYKEVSRDVSSQIDALRSDLERMCTESASSFADVSEQEREPLRQFDLMCRLASDIYVRKLLLEKMIDMKAADREKEQEEEKKEKKEQKE